MLITSSCIALLITAFKALYGQRAPIKDLHLHDERGLVESILCEGSTLWNSPFLGARMSLRSWRL